MTPQPRNEASAGRPARLLVAPVGEAEGAGSLAAALAVLLAGERGPSLLIDLDLPSGRPRPTLLASSGAREVEERLARAGERSAARGHVCHLWLGNGEGGERIAAALELAPPSTACVVHCAPAQARALIEGSGPGFPAVCLRADLPRERALTALAFRDLQGPDARVRVAKRPLPWLASRRASAGLPPGGEPERRLRRLARRLLGERGQALPGALGAAAIVLIAALALVAIAGALTGKGRVQRAADLSAVSAVRSMRDDVDRLLAPSRLPDGTVNPRRLSKAEFLARARAAALQAARKNGVDPRRLRLGFPDRASFAPTRARVTVLAEIPSRPGSREPAHKVVATAVAEAAPAAGGPGEMPATASGGGYAGPLVYRNGEGMRPDVAAAFDRMKAAAADDGILLSVTSGFRSDAEQAALFAANPDPRWVAPPGTSLHRCATELDLGPPSAYGWLAANGSRFGFLKRYSWEPWHWGFVAGPAPCSPEGESVAIGDGAASALGDLPAFVPARFRGPLMRSASRWNVSAALLAAQLEAESGFDPNAVSPAGAQGIAQFISTTAAAYGLGDPFDPEAAIDAQAHLMSDLLRQFGSVRLALAAYNAGPAPVAACGCVPPYPETVAYVARIIALLDGTGLLFAPPLEVRLIA